MSQVTEHELNALVEQIVFDLFKNDLNAFDFLPTKISLEINDDLKARIHVLGVSQQEQSSVKKLSNIQIAEFIHKLQHKFPTIQFEYISVTE